jgi:hypothetical protein
MRVFPAAVVLAAQALALPASPVPSPTATPSPVENKISGPRPAQSVPDQPFTGTPVPRAKPYEAILKAREAGARNEALLAKVRREKVVYSLTTYDIQKLRSAGVSAAVIEAMLKSGRSRATPGAPALPAVTPTRSAAAATPSPTPR